MNSLDKLDEYLDEYLNDADKTSIQHIAFIIPGHKGFFGIRDSFFITSFDSNMAFKLVIIFSFNPNTKQGKAMLHQVDMSSCFQDFTKRKDGRSIIFIKETENDKKDIRGIIENITTTLFPQINMVDIDVELKKIPSRFTLGV